MMDPTSLPALVAQTAVPQPSLIAQIWPLAAMMLIFYFLVLMPMRKRQKKVQEFQAALKPGDRVVTTGGIYGQITKVTDQTVQLQVAQNVRIDIAKVAIGGMQGQEPVVETTGNA